MHAAIRGKRKATIKYGISMFYNVFFRTIEAYTEKIIIVVQIIEERSNVTLRTP